MRSGPFRCGDQAPRRVSVTAREDCKTSAMPNHVPHPREGPRHGGIRSGLSQMIKTSYSDLGLNVLFPSSSSYLIRRASPSPSSGRTAVGMGTRGVPRLIFSLPSAFVPWCLAPAESGGTRGQGRRGDVTARKSRWAPVETPGRGDLLHAGCPQSWSSRQFPRAASLSAANQVA